MENLSPGITLEGKLLSLFLLLLANHTHICVCVCICIFVYVCVCMCTRKCKCMCMHMCMCTCMFLCICIYIFVARICIYMYVYLHMCVYMCVYIYIPVLPSSHGFLPSCVLPRLCVQTLLSFSNKDTRFRAHSHIAGPFLTWLLLLSLCYPTKSYTPSTLRTWENNTERDEPDCAR